MTRPILLLVVLAAVCIPCFAAAPAPAPAPMPCTSVSSTGVCDRYQGSAFCNTPAGSLMCPPGTTHRSSSSTPQPCVPEGGPCVRTVYCCADDVASFDEPKVDLGSCELPSEQPPVEPVAKTQPAPPPGLQCLYTCTEGGTEWELMCAEDTADECCEIADQVCPYLVPGSTGAVSCIC